MVVAALSSDKLLVGLGMELLGLRSVTPTETRLFLVGAVELSWCRMGVSGVDMRVPSGVTALLIRTRRHSNHQRSRLTFLLFVGYKNSTTLQVVKLPLNMH